MDQPTPCQYDPIKTAAALAAARAALETALSAVAAAQAPLEVDADDLTVFGAHAALDAARSYVRTALAELGRCADGLPRATEAST